MYGNAKLRHWDETAGISLRDLAGQGVEERRESLTRTRGCLVLNGKGKSLAAGKPGWHGGKGRPSFPHSGEVITAARERTRRYGRH